MKTAILTGPTATGKSSLALELALQHGAIEIINADSMLVYRGMDIGTAKPTLEERTTIPHHLIDICDPSEVFTAGEFVRATNEAIEDIHARGKRALIVGGTGFYLKALLYGLWKAPKADLKLRAALEEHASEDLFKDLAAKDPDSAKRIGPKDRYRLIRALELIQLSGKTPTQLQAAQPKNPDPRFPLWVVDLPNPALYPRITVRTHAMLAQGFIEEVKTIREKFPSSRAFLAVGYAQVCDYLDHKIPVGRVIPPGVEGLEEEISLATRQLVKRQRTWFRGQKQHAKMFNLQSEREALIKEFVETYREKT